MIVNRLYNDYEDEELVYVNCLNSIWYGGSVLQILFVVVIIVIVGLLWQIQGKKLVDIGKEYKFFNVSKGFIYCIEVVLLGKRYGSIRSRRVKFFLIFIFIKVSGRQFINCKLQQ